MVREVWEQDKDGCSFLKKLQLLRGKRIQKADNAETIWGKFFWSTGYLHNHKEHPHRLLFNYKRELKSNI